MGGEERMVLFNNMLVWYRDHNSYVKCESQFWAIAIHLQVSK